MSSYNSNFVPPPPNGNPGNLLNGQPAAQQPPQFYQQQQQPQPLPQQQQQQLKPAQFQQYPINATPTGPAQPSQFNNNVMNKFMPPAMSNGPLGHFPPHLRPPVMNGPGPTPLAPGSLTNGSNGALSANSSRTASPGLMNNNTNVNANASIVTAESGAPPPPLVSAKPHYVSSPLGVKLVQPAPPPQQQLQTADSSSIPLSASQQLKPQQSFGSPLPQHQQPVLEAAMASPAQPTTDRMGAMLGANFPPQQPPSHQGAAIGAAQPPLPQSTPSGLMPPQQQQQQQHQHQPQIVQQGSAMSLASHQPPVRMPSTLGTSQQSISQLPPSVSNSIHPPMQQAPTRTEQGPQPENMLHQRPSISQQGSTINQGIAPQSSAANLPQGSTIGQQLSSAQLPPTAPPQAGSTLTPQQSAAGLMGAAMPPQTPPTSQSDLKAMNPMANLSSNMQNMNLNPSVGHNPMQSLGQKDFRGVAMSLAGTTFNTDPNTGNSLLSSGLTPALPNQMVAPFNSSMPTTNSPASIFGATSSSATLSTKPTPPAAQKMAYGVVPPPAVSGAGPSAGSGAGEQNNNAQRAPPPAAAQRPPLWQAPVNALPNLPGMLKPQGFVPSPLPPINNIPPQGPPQIPPYGQPAAMEKPMLQQQYPYKQAYPQTMPPQHPQQQQQHQQPMPPTGMFGAQQQPSNAPLQYQTQGAAQQQPLSVAQQGFSRLWGQDTVDLMQNRHILSPATIAPPKIVLHNQFHESINCNPSIIRCTLAKIPESNSLLQKSRLPLGIVIHPFRDVNSLPVIQCHNIVRCRLCRTYINPFVYFVDSKMWKCNLCYRVNELPDDFQFDPATKTYGDVTRRPEVRSSTIEFIAPSEYMLRPPQPAMYLFLFDVSIIAQQSGYLESACAVLNRHLDDMPGDARTQVGFICYDSYVHFYSMADGLNQPHEMTLLDIDDPFLPRPDSLLVNLKECKELVKDLLRQLPKRFAHTHDPGSALGAALQVAFKLMQASGGRITVFQSCLPNKGPGALQAREDPNNRSSKDVAHLNPATDFYKRYALECSGYQIAVDLFLMNQQYSDIATISGISKHSGGCVHHFPLYQKTKQHMVDSFRQCFKRYLTRKIGFEAVMRIRCTRGLQVHTFHGNFFVRSTDLLSLPNVNPDAGYGLQISYEESLTDVKTICFQAALLYTNSEGERRIRVHTVCLPVTASLPEVMHSADTEAIVGLLSKMAVDRSVTSNLSDARDAFINATIDVFNAFKIAQNLPSGQSGQLIAPRSLALLPLYILALLKHPAFRVGTSTRLDDRVFAMDCMKTLPLDQLMKYVYPELYKLDALIYHARTSNMNNTQHDDDDDDDDLLPEMTRLQLSAEHLDSRSIFLMDCGTLIMLYVGINVPTDVLESLLGISSTAELADYVYGLPSVSSAENDALKRFLLRLNYDKPYAPLVQIIRDTSTAKAQFIEKLTDDRSESSLSYYEFLQHIRAQVK